MNIKNSQPNALPAPRQQHASRLTKLETYVAILGTVLGLLFTWSQLRIASSEEARAKRSEPLAYSLEAVNTHYEYEIQKDGAALTLPAPSLRLHVTHGSLHSITAISYDGTAFYELSSLPIKDIWSDCTVDITMPTESILTSGALVFDYFFLFLEPTEGQAQLDLICNTISLDTQTVQSSVLHPIDLIQLEELPDGPQRELLTVYARLLEKMEAQGLLSA